MVRTFFALCLLLAAGLCSAETGAGSGAKQTLRELTETTPCRLGGDAAPYTVRATCRYMLVPEDRSKPDSPMIKLAIAWIPAETADPEPDPFIYVAGGPGQSALESYPNLHHALAGVRAKRNTVLMDQRGTGDSNALHCDSAMWTDPSLTGELSPAQAQAMVTSCVSSLSSRADLRHYTTTEAVADLEDLRLALQLPAWNMLGVSYGTRVLQQFVKKYPNSVRSLILDGVVPNEVNLGNDHARFLDAALDGYFKRCKQQAHCAKLDRREITTLLQDLKQNPRKVRFRHAITGKWQQNVFHNEHLSLLLRLFSYRPDTAALLPALVAQAKRGEFDTLAALAYMQGSDLSKQMAMGMSLSVSCSEDGEKLQTHEIDQYSILGEEFAAHLKRLCQYWPKGNKPDAFNEPLNTSVPALVLSGENDPVTPPVYGAQVAAQLPNSRHVVAPGQGHFVSIAGCMPQIITEFIDHKDVDELDTNCLDRLYPLPLAVDLYGPNP